MKKTPNPSSFSNLEEKYIELKRTLYAKLFSYVVLTNMGIIIIELLRAVIYSQTRSFLTLAVVLTFTVILNKFVSRVEKNKELIITGSIGLFYFSGLMANYHGKAGYFDNSLDSFYFAYALALFERLVVARIPTFSFRVAFNIGTTLIRILIIPSNDQAVFSAQFLYLFFGIYLDLDKEIHDKNLFQSYMTYKDQLRKFKDLVVNEIPEGILIIDLGLTKPLFMNNSFESLFGGTDLNKNIRKQLEKFIIEENLQLDTTFNTRDTSYASKQTLLSFLKSTIHDDSANFLANKKFSCNVHNSKSAIKQGTNGIFEDNQTSIFEVKFFHIVWDEKSAVAIILNDITQQHIIISLKSADAHKDSILTTLSHELRTPLNGMLGMIQIIQKQLKDPELLNYLNICKNSGALLMGLVNSILDLNQIRIKKLKLSLGSVDINELLNEMISLFELQCAQKGLYLKLNIFPKTSRVLLTDRERLSQIFINLIANAVKFTEKGGIIISASEEADGNYIRLSIEDTGIGLNNEDRHKILSHGGVEENYSKLNLQGVGLGLTISDNLAKLLCSNDKISGIKVRSTYKKGSIFIFTINTKLQDPEKNTELNLGSSTWFSDFPKNSTDEFGDVNSKMKNYSQLLIKSSHTFQRISQANIGKYETFDFLKPGQDKTKLNKNLRSYSENYIYINQSRQLLPYILIVDDNPFNITVAEYMIMSHGYKVKTALYGQTAIDILSKNDYSKDPICLILMDCQMPIMNGYETTKILRKMMEKKQIPEIPIVALTANNSEADKEACRKVGMCEHLTKPLKETELLRILNEFTVINI